MSGASVFDSRSGSAWQLPSSVFRVGLNAQEHRLRWLAETRSALDGTYACGGVRLVAVECHPDLWLIAGAADWAEGVTLQLRRVGDPTPIVVLNASAENSTNARILDAGADDCLACPFDPAELRARVQAVIRRQASPLTRGREIATDRATLRIRVREVEARVSRKQFEIFVYLAQRRERWVHSSEIIAAVCGTHHDPTTSLVRVQVHALRKSLGAARDCICCNGHKSYMLTLAMPTPQFHATRSLLTAK